MQNRTQNRAMQIIRLTSASDRAFAEIAQMASVSGATLPSGMQVPTVENKNDAWMIWKNCIVLVQKNNQWM